MPGPHIVNARSARRSVPARLIPGGSAARAVSINMLFADGSVHFRKSSIDPIPWRDGDTELRRDHLERFVTSEPVPGRPGPDPCERRTPDRDAFAE